MLKSSLYDYSNAYILVKQTISIAPVPSPAENPNNNNKEVVFKNCALFTDCISEKNNTQMVNAKDIDVVMPTYSLIEYSDNHSKTSGRIWQYYRDEPFLDDNKTIANFPSANNNSALFKFKQKIPSKIADGNLRRTLEMPLTYCESSLILTLSEKYVLSNDPKATIFGINDTKLYVPVVTLSNQDNAKLLQ